MYRDLDLQPEQRMAKQTACDVLASPAADEAVVVRGSA
jgi:hypothetical protein